MVVADNLHLLPVVVDGDQGVVIDTDEVRSLVQPDQVLHHQRAVDALKLVQCLLLSATCSYHTWPI